MDFSKLKARTPEEVERDRVARQERFYAEEDRERDKYSVTAVTLTLLHEPETRMTMGGERLVLMRGPQDGQDASSVAVYTVPARVEDQEREAEAFDRSMRDLGGGDRVSFAGRWSARHWKAQDGSERKAWEFRAQYFAKGDLSLEQIVEKARVDRGEAISREPSETGRNQARATQAAAARQNGIGA